MSVKRYEFELYHCNGGEMLVSDTGDYVSYEDYAALEQRLADSQREFRAADATIENLQMQVETLAAESASKSRCLGFFASVIKSGEEWTSVCQHEYSEALKNPATDAFLAEVRAQGVEMFAAHKRERQQALRSRSMRMSEEAAGMAADAENFADELRKGVLS
ncbi:TPA: hypothetical protein ACW7O9_002723 [Enterobacter hormaechei subsp. steigerwaltii]|uniref:hypothetical protein n=1 Tax=Enterobacter roggenkampii TaxID=1812935 RepID=UPI003D6EF9B1